MKTQRSLFARHGRILITGLALLTVLSLGAAGFAQEAWEAEWQQLQEAARKERKVVMGIPPSAELRTALESALKRRFGIELEVVQGLGSTIAKRVGDEYKAGIRYFDVIISTWDNLDHSLIPMGAVEPLENYWILPEVKDPKQWFAGHHWTDKTRRYAYAPMGYMLDNIWYNTDQVKPEEIQKYSDLLNPKWKGRIALWDPRAGGAIAGIWGFLYTTQGEEFLKRLAQQVSLISTDRRLIADSLARGKSAITIGPTFYSFQPYIKAGLPVRPFPPFKEGTFVSIGNGGPVIVKNQPHPNATKLLVNWLLSKEGQEVYSKAFGQATRRLDVDTKWMAEFGTRAAKDSLTVEEFHRYENQTQDKILSVRRPAQSFAKQIFP